jgi:hypothetical protein
MRDITSQDVASEADVFESWSRYLDDHLAPQMPVQFDMLAATGPWAWWATGA